MNLSSTIFAIETAPGQRLDLRAPSSCQMWSLFISWLKQSNNNAQVDVDNSECISNNRAYHLHFGACSPVEALWVRCWIHVLSTVMTYKLVKITTKVRQIIHFNGPLDCVYCPGSKRGTRPVDIFLDNFLYKIVTTEPWDVTAFMRNKLVLIVPVFPSSKWPTLIWRTVNWRLLLKNPTFGCRC